MIKTGFCAYSPAFARFPAAPPPSAPPTGVPSANTSTSSSLSQVKPPARLCPPPPIALQITDTSTASLAERRDT